VDAISEGVKIDAFQPSAISLRLEPIVRKELQIEARLDGTPAEGYQVYGVRLSKATVTASGPASKVNAIPKAMTETISVQGRKESFTAANVSLDIADPKVDMLNPVVSVDVEIGDKRAERVFENVPVNADSRARLLQRTATVTLSGPSALLSQLQSGDVTLRLNGDGTAVIDLPQAYQGKILLKSTKPEKFLATR
jgi:YbbR domain-containing protein